MRNLIIIGDEANLFNGNLVFQLFQLNFRSHTFNLLIRIGGINIPDGDNNELKRTAKGRSLSSYDIENFKKRYQNLVNKMNIFNLI